MGMLIAGVLLWSIMHLMKSVTPGVRASIQGAIGEGPHKGLVALLLLGSLALMIFGWRSTPAEFVYDPPTWGRHANMTLMFFAILLIGAAQGASRIRQWIRHPMLTGVLVWAVGHLLANGDNKSLVLFGGLGLWALISIITVSRNEGAWVKPAKVATAGRELLSLVITAILYAILMFIHPWIAGVPVIAG
ncbi:MAG: NnrU protein [Sphingomonadales bacterium]|nr:NnrU protein [Sphingomonadales bacterium]PIX65119.1 MAG: NnrU protein [Sphingomonadales bacterium CG_4_10_14_3_um_filter_58_15]NCO47641.1 NnrU protein [Sphingomonadales bacterium]NCP00339.1 NnrU protein [Sphingomonadales bacterium]NCP26831.1 NnrU protein [Sphingomonadales bacterium]